MASATRPDSLARLMSRDELVMLTKRNDVTAAAHLLIRFSFHAALMSLALYVGNHFGLVWGFIVLMPHFAASSFLGWAGIGHELFHNSVFKSRAINQFLFKAFSILTWNNYGYFQATHPYHHRHTLRPGDAEGARHPPISTLALIRLFSFDVPAFYRRVRVLALNARGIVPVGNESVPLFAEGTQARRNLVTAARWVLLVQTGLLLGFVMAQMYWLIIAVNLAPFCVTFFNRTLAISQHYGLSSQAEGDYLESCRTIVMHPVLAFFYANMNFHVEHHMYPSVPYYNLPRLSERLRSRVTLKHWSAGYFQALRLLNNLGLFRL
jgi:fatty acid desaturase